MGTISRRKNYEENISNAIKKVLHNHDYETLSHCSNNSLVRKIPTATDNLLEKRLTHRVSIPNG